MENLKPFIICPITRQIMFDPVQLSGDKHTYEREAITRHLATNNKSPVTNGKLGSDTGLEVNGAIHSLITNYLAQHPEEYENDNVYFPEATMWNAIEKNDIETVAKLFRVDKRFLSEKNAKGITAFQQLCQTGSEAMLEKIINQLNDPQKQQLLAIIPPKSWQPHTLDKLLLSVVKAGNDKGACFCLELGASINRPCLEDRHFTALHYAIEHHHAKTVELLIARGAGLELKAQEGSTPLHIASLYNNSHALEQLLKFKSHIDVNIKSDNGNTPLHVALIHGHKAIALLLMQAGADLDIKNNAQQTPYDMANAEMRTWFMAQKKQLKAEKTQGVWNTLHAQAQTMATLEQRIQNLQNLQAKQAVQINQLNAEIQIDKNGLKSLAQQIEQVIDGLNKQQKTFNQLDGSLPLSVEATATEVPSLGQRLTQSVPHFFKPVQQINNPLAQGVENKITPATLNNSV